MVLSTTEKVFKTTHFFSNSLTVFQLWPERRTRRCTYGLIRRRTDVKNTT